jgi:hypothetical protein
LKDDLLAECIQDESKCGAHVFCPPVSSPKFFNGSAADMKIIMNECVSILNMHLTQVIVFARETACFIFRKPGSCTFRFKRTI